MKLFHHEWAYVCNGCLMVSIGRGPSKAAIRQWMIPPPTNPLHVNDLKRGMDLQCDWCEKKGNNTLYRCELTGHPKKAA